MSSSQAISQIKLDWPVDLDFRAVGRFVLGGVAARTDLAVDRLDELGLVIDSLARVPTIDDRVQLELEVAPTQLIVTVGAFSTDPLGDLAVNRVVTALADAVTPLDRGREHWVVLSMFLSDLG
jgi:hypothetical protein